MYLLEIDRSRNQIHITLSDHFDVPEAKALLRELKSRSNEVKEGFNVLCDLTALNTFDLSARKHFRAVMDLCNKNGVSRIIRIIPDPLNNFGLTVMSYFHYAKGVKIITCSDLKEALEHLK